MLAASTVLLTALPNIVVSVYVLTRTQVPFHKADFA